ncbi:tetratricopeptide repeat protein [Bacillus licheniformis]|nr:tetratricopeptide repeat protein [Bacillus licheniformis]
MNIYKCMTGTKKLAISQVVMGTNYMQMQRFKDAEKYFEESIEISKRLTIHFRSDASPQYQHSVFQFRPVSGMHSRRPACFEQRRMVQVKLLYQLALHADQRVFKSAKQKRPCSIIKRTGGIKENGNKHYERNKYYL